MKIVTMFLVLCICFSICVSANDLKNEIYTYELEEFICIKEINDKSLTGKITVPAYIDNVAVKKINSHTFLNSNVAEIEFEEGIEEILSYAISDCVNLKKIVIPASCKIIGGVSYMPAIQYCENLETIEIHGEYDSLPLFIADCPNIKNIIFYGDIKYITNEFKYNFYKCEPRVKRVNPRVFNEAISVTIQGKAGSNIEKFAIDNGFNFVSLEKNEKEIISKWAKPEVEKAIEKGFVPLSFRGNYKKNITRAEFAKLAICFLSTQYGYSVVPESLYYSTYAGSDNGVFPPEFMNAYAHARTDRNGKSFIDKYTGEKYVYHNTNVQIDLHDLPFQDIDENECVDLPFIERAYYIGIVNGISETAFNPNGNITRQEAAAMLMRVYKNYADFEKKDSDFKYADDEKISEWAKEDVYSINKLGIMQGVGENLFSPTEGYTVEQAIATFWRLYNSAPVSRKNKNIKPLLDYKFESENYCNRDGGGSYFHETTRKEYDDFIYIYGYWTQRHSTEWTYSLYVFDKSGGVALNLWPDDDFEWEVSSDGKILTTHRYHTDAFTKYDKMTGLEKEYSKGMYRCVYDMDERKLLIDEKVE